MWNTVGALLAVLASLGQAPAEPADDREDRQRFMQAMVAELSLHYRDQASKPLALTPEPVLRYSNAERAIGALEGVTFLWLDGMRPVAAVSLAIRRLNDGVYRECASLSSEPLQCFAGETPVWAPRTGGLLARPLAEDPPPQSRPLRLAQMRAIARRFTVTYYHSRTNEPTVLRLLPQPLHRFADEQAGIVDGALFAFVVSNDPEFLLLVEAVKPAAGEPRWQYSLARMSSQKHVVRLDGDEIWSVPNYHEDPTEDRRTGPYVESRIGKYTPTGEAPRAK